MKKVIITGATGLAGRYIIEELKDHYELIIFSRHPDYAEQLFPGIKTIKYKYNVPDSWENAVNGAYGIIHLAGENISSGRWNKLQKQKIYNSRVISTRMFTEVFDRVDNPLKVFITASATGYYGYSETEQFTEQDSPGEGFLSFVCRDWENAAVENLPDGIRQVSVRNGIILDDKSGALALMKKPYELYAGGKIGTGRQWMSWIHPGDMARIYRFILENDNISGPVNAVAPNPVRMEEFAKTLGKVLKKPAIIPVPSIVVKLVMGEAAELALKGANVIPQKLKDFNFTFNFPEVEDAFRDIF